MALVVEISGLPRVRTVTKVIFDVMTNDVGNVESVKLRAAKGAQLATAQIKFTNVEAVQRACRVFNDVIFDEVWPTKTYARWANEDSEDELPVIETVLSSQQTNMMTTANDATNRLKQQHQQLKTTTITPTSNSATTNGEEDANEQTKATGAIERVETHSFENRSSEASGYTSATTTSSEGSHGRWRCGAYQERPRLQCQNCRKIGHVIDLCPHIKCFRCNNMGHMTTACAFPPPERRTNSRKSTNVATMNRMSAVKSGEIGKEYSAPLATTEILANMGILGIDDAFRADNERVKAVSTQPVEEKPAEPNVKTNVIDDDIKSTVSSSSDASGSQVTVMFNEGHDV